MMYVWGRGSTRKDPQPRPVFLTCFVWVATFIRQKSAQFVTAWGSSHVGRQPIFLGSSLQESLVSHAGQPKPELQGENSGWRNRCLYLVPDSQSNLQCPL